MPIDVPTAAVVASKWAEVTPGRQRYYQANTPPSAERWSANTQAAGAAFGAGISAGDIVRRFTGGVRKAGADKFRRKVETIGAGRFGPGVTAATADMQSGVEPYLATIAGLTLPGRAPRGDESNIERVRVIARALSARRLALIGAG
ncbi:MAG: hypothetical protein Q8K72_19265 [Acidimicrobiales bacterium]|nr:hypothetical protein [Acidimicrobiales bacterium]